MDYDKLKEVIDQKLKDLKYSNYEKELDEFINYLKKKKIQINPENIASVKFLDGFEEKKRIITLKKMDERIEIKFDLNDGQISQDYNYTYNLISKENEEILNIVNKLFEYKSDKEILKDLEDFLKRKNKTLSNIALGIPGIILQIGRLQNKNIFVFDNSILFSVNIFKNNVESIEQTPSSESNNSIKISDNLLNTVEEFVKNNINYQQINKLGEIVLNYLDPC